MNRIRLENIAKRYAREWIFRGVSYEFHTNQAYVILGSNGSGKSTLLQILSSFLTASKGSLYYFLDEKEIPIEKVYKHISLATPYMELPEEFTLREVIDFQAKLKPFINELQCNEIIELMELEHAADKPINKYSSGMKQRVKLGLAILSNSSILLLDEPSSNLDEAAIKWFQNLINSYKKNRIIVVCSNHIKAEYLFCEHQIVMDEFKKSPNQ